ncbi:hypothetical protein WJX77_008692 [Trebouxia sp. C0004]
MSQNVSLQTEIGATAVNVEAAPVADSADQNTQRYHWTPRKFCQSIFLFILSAASEVGGGWLVWQSIRSGKPWWWGLLGSVTLVVYGFLPTLQPVDQFGRTFAAYGGFFIVYSYGWGYFLDHERPDTGDFAGAGIALAGVCICWFWPRKVPACLAAAAAAAAKIGTTCQNLQEEENAAKMQLCRHSLSTAVLEGLTIAHRPVISVPCEQRATRTTAYGHRQSHFC